MEKIQIYIDSAVGVHGEIERAIISQLRKINENISVVLYDDFIDETSEFIDWELVTLNAINESKIVIPLLTPDYFDFASERVGAEFSKIIDSDNKYLLPILVEESDWSSFSWVVKSHILPNDGRALSELSESKVRKAISDLVGIVKNAIDQSSMPASTIPVIDSLTTSNKSIFISHSHEDADFAELLKLRLEKKGIEAWIDNERLKIGQDWREEIDSGIENATAIIAVMTPEARKSEYVTYEWAFAWGRKKKVFPLMLKQTQLHPRLESLQYMDFTNRSARPWDELIESILKEVA